MLNTFFPFEDEQDSRDEKPPAGYPDSSFCNIHLFFNTRIQLFDDKHLPFLPSD
jgi:hypothetical protein